jgi:hypothetical protein
VLLPREDAASYVPISGMSERRLVFAVGIRNVGVRKARDFGDQVDDVHSESIDALVEPELHQVVDGVSDFWVLPVEVGLLEEHIR